MKPSWIIVAGAVVQVRCRPDHRAELTSQLLLGECARVRSARFGGQWLRVRSATDGYEGWVRAMDVVPATARESARWRRRARGRVQRALVRPGPAGAGLPAHLCLNARVITGRREGRRRRVMLPDGKAAWLPVGALAAARPIGLRARVRSLLGVPYLWGGRTPLGFDCSGFTQQVLAEQGVALPRDAQRQFAQSRPIAANGNVRPGDLVFFRDRLGTPAHVGLMISGDLYAQARGHVRISSVSPANVLYDKALDGTMLGIRRPRRRSP